MKKTYSTLTIVMLLMASMVFAQSPRTVLFEEFTGENCNPCAANNPYLKRFSALTAQDSFIHLAYQVPIPSAGPIYNSYPTVSMSRFSYYVPAAGKSAPYYKADGVSYTGWQGATNLPINYFDSASIQIQNTYGRGQAAADATTPTSPFFTARHAVSSPCTINITHHFSPAFDSVYAMAVVYTTATTKASAAGKLKFQFVLTEKQLTYTYAPGTNGETTFENVMRKMYPTVAGTTMADSLWVGRYDTFRVASTIPTYLRDLSQIQFVGWVQDDGTFDVKQAAVSAVIPTTNFTDMAADGDSVKALSCTTATTTTVPLWVNLRNTGSKNLTSCTIGVSVNNGAPTNTNWTGSIAPGTAQMVSAGSVTGGSGQNSYKIIISNPNSSTARTAVFDTTKGNFAIAGKGAPMPYVQNFEDTNIIYPANVISDYGVWLPSFIYGGAGTGSSSVNSMACYWHERTNGYLSQDVFYLPKLDLTTATACRMTFDRAYQQTHSTVTQNNSTDSINIQYSTDCGFSWTTVWGKGGANLATVPRISTSSSTFNGYAPTTASEWAKDLANLDNATTFSDVWVRLLSTTSKLGIPSDFYIDNINISATIIGIKEVQNVQGVSLYPSPAHGVVTLDMITTQSAPTTITLVNIIGEEVKTAFDGPLAEGSHHLEINLANIANGVYNMVITSAGEKTVKKFVVSGN